MMTETAYQSTIAGLESSLSDGFQTVCRENKREILAGVGGTSAIVLAIAWPIAVKAGTVAARFLARVALRHLGQMRLDDVFDLIQAFRSKEHAGR